MVTDIFTIYTLKHVWNMDFDFRVRRVDIRLLLIQVKFIRDTHFIIMQFETHTKKNKQKQQLILSEIYLKDTFQFLLYELCFITTMVLLLLFRGLLGQYLYGDNLYRFKEF